MRTCNCNCNRNFINICLVLFELNSRSELITLLVVRRGVTLVVSSGFLPQNFGRRQGPTTGTLSFYECRLSGGEPPRTLQAVI